MFLFMLIAAFDIDYYSKPCGLKNIFTKGYYISILVIVEL